MKKIIIDCCLIMMTLMMMMMMTMIMMMMMVAVVKMVTVMMMMVTMCSRQEDKPCRVWIGAQCCLVHQQTLYIWKIANADSTGVQSPPGNKSYRKLTCYYVDSHSSRLHYLQYVSEAFAL